MGNLRDSMVALALFAFAVPAMANTEKVAPNVFKQANGGEVSALIILNEQADLSGVQNFETKESKGRYVYNNLTAVAEGQDGALALIKKRGLRHQRFYVINAIAIFNASKADIEALAALPEVGRIISNESVEALPKRIATLTNSPVVRGVGSNIAQIKAEQVWSQLGVQGEGIVVGGIDTGVEWTHPALKTQYRGNVEGKVQHSRHWHDAIREPIAINKRPNICGYDLAEPCDDHDHGTHTLGSAVGSDGGENQIGVAPKAKWIACRSMDQGTGRPSTYLDCLEFMLAPFPKGKNGFEGGDPALAPHVINNSWGCPASEECLADELLPAVQALKAAGIMMVVSAGNDGPGCDTVNMPPAKYTAEAFIVGAYDHTTDNVAYFSSRGPSPYSGEVAPHVTAPGVNVRSAVRGGVYQGVLWSGTSMAAPHVAGTVALMWSANRELVGHIDATADILKQTAKSYKPEARLCSGDASDSVPNNHSGWGLIDANAAVMAGKALRH